MTVSILIGDVRDKLRELPADFFDCVFTSPPYWGLRDYDVAGQIGLEPTLGEHLAVMVEVFAEVRRVLKPSGTCFVNYGDCYATKPNGRSAAATKAAGGDDRTFRDKPFSTVGAIYEPQPEGRQAGRRGRGGNLGNGALNGKSLPAGRVVAGGYLKPKDLCMVPNRLAIAMQDAGWWVRSEIVWGKPNPMPDSSGKYRPSTAHEKVWLFTKTGKSFYDAEPVALPVTGTSHARLSQNLAAQIGSARANGGGNMKAVARKTPPKTALAGAKTRNNPGMDAHLSELPGARETRYLRNYEPAALRVWHVATAGFSEAHFATFPPELVERGLLMGCPKGGRVLDPFGGAGTTGLVADALGMDCTLIELNPDYAEIAARRLRAGLVRVLGVPHATAAGPLFDGAAA